MMNMNIKDAIAIVGMGCRFPGGANNPEKYWELLKNGIDAVAPIPENRWDINRYYDSDSSKSGKTLLRKGGFLDSIDGFDASFFDISNSEAPHMDPQQRILLEITWEALEDAFCPPSTLRGSNTSVFMGMFSLDYHVMQAVDPFQRSAGVYSATGSTGTLLANRISHVFDWRGASITLDTACSSSLTAIHLACESLKRKESEMALAGGALLMISPAFPIIETKAGLHSPDNLCKAFDASANGYVRGEGAGVVLLKRLEDALASGDNIRAVITASGVNQDGNTDTVTAPSAAAQISLMKKTCKLAHISRSAIQYVEAHGTGTALGDVTEAFSLGESYGKRGDRAHPLLVGSCKTNIGHTEAAAGIAGLMKTVLALEHKQIPPNLHFNMPNPQIDFEKWGLQVVDTLRPWPSCGDRATAAVNSFGFGGANAHVIITEAPKVDDAQIRISSALYDRTDYFLPLSAKTQGALIELTEQYKLMDIQQEDLYDLCYTASVYRDHFPFRKIFHLRQARDIKQLPDKQVNIYDMDEYSETYKIVNGYLKGEIVDWKKLYPSGRKIKIPLYPWQRKICWHEPLPSLHARLAVNSKPLLGRRLETHPPAWEEEISCKTYPFLQDHQVLGNILYPAACSISAIVEGVFSITGDYTMSVEHIQLKKGLKLNKGQSSIIRHHIDLQNGIFSILEQKKQGDYDELVSGRLSHINGMKPKKIVIDDYKRRMDKRYEPSILYPILAKHEFYYGECFQGIQELWLKDKKSFSKISLPQNTSLLFDPALLDSCFQNLLAIEFLQNTGYKFMTPVEIGSFRMFRKPEKEVWAYAEIDFQDETTIMGNITIYNTNGLPVAEISQFTRKTIDSAVSLSQCFMKTQWMPESHQDMNPTIPPGKWVVIKNGQKIGSTLHRNLEGSTLFEDTEGFTEHYDGSTNPEGVIWCYDHYIADASSMRRSCQTFITLIQFMIKHMEETKLWLIGADNLWFAPFNGIFRTLSKEHPRMAGGILIPDPDGFEQNNMAFILHNINGKRDGIQVKYRGRKQYSMQAVPCALSEQYLPVSFDSSDLFLITGAFGGIGGHIVEELINRGVSRFAFISPQRTEKDVIEKRELYLQQMRRRGIHITYGGIDIRDASSLAHFVTELEKVEGAVTGVVHGAGLLHDALIQNITGESLEELFQIKINGAWNLHNHFKNKRLKHFILFSSAASVFPYPGQCSYSAANAFLDALAEYRVKMGLAGFSIGWGPWTVGMTVQSETKNLFAKRGISLIEPATGRELFYRALAMHEPHLIAMWGNWEKISRNDRDNPLYTVLNEAGQKFGCTTVQKPENITAYLSSQIKDYLDADDEDIDIDESLSYLGMDSLSALELLNALSEEFDIHIPIGEFMRKSIRDLCEILEGV